MWKIHSENGQMVLSDFHVTDSDICRDIFGNGGLL